MSKLVLLPDFCYSSLPKYSVFPACSSPIVPHFKPYIITLKIRCIIWACAYHPVRMAPYRSSLKSVSLNWLFFTSSLSFLSTFRTPRKQPVIHPFQNEVIIVDWRLLPNFLHTNSESMCARHCRLTTFGSWAQTTERPQHGFRCHGPTSDLLTASSHFRSASINNYGESWLISADIYKA